MRKAVLLAGAAIACIFVSAPAIGQTSNEPQTAQTDDSGDIVVTAQKRDQRLLDVPVAVTAVSTDDLVAQNRTSIADFYDRVPGLQYNGQRTSQLSLRGVTSGGASNPTVALLVDDVQFGSSTYLGNAMIPDFDPAVLDRIEVLRGPQGTLYGASSLGGLIKYVTKAPDPNKFSGRMEVGASKVADGGYGQSLRGSVNVPIIADKVALSVSGFLNEAPQWVDNLTANPAAPGVLASAIRMSDTNKVKNWGGRAALLVKPVDALTLTFSAIRQRTDIAGGATYNVASLTDFTSVNTNAAVGPRGAPISDRTTALNLAVGNRDFRLYSARAELDLSFATLTSVSAWGQSRVSDASDTTNRFRFLLSVYPTGQSISFANLSSLNKFSQELRLAGSGPVVDWLVGGFYTKEHADAPQVITAQGANGAFVATPYAGLNPSSYREIAGFADVTWHITNRFDLQVGGRYAANKQTYSAISNIDTPAQIFFGPSTVDVSGSSDHAFTWLVTPSFKIAPGIMAYARVATGYRPGGVNAIVSTIPKSFGADRVTSYELGLKGRTSNRLLTYDIAAFQIDWKDIQLQNTDIISQFVFYTNGGKARSRGIEGQVQLKPWAGFTADANATFTDATLRATLPALAGSTPLLGVSGDRLPASAKVTASLSAQQDLTLSNHIDAFVGGSLAYVGERFGNFTNTVGAGRPKLPGYTTLDLRAGFSIDKRWQLTVYARNVTDERGLLTLDNAGGTQIYPQAVFIQPRTIGFSVSGAF